VRTLLSENLIIHEVLGNLALDVTINQLKTAAKIYIKDFQKCWKPMETADGLFDQKLQLCQWISNWAKENDDIDCIISIKDHLAFNLTSFTPDQREKIVQKEASYFIQSNLLSTGKREREGDIADRDPMIPIQHINVQQDVINNKANRMGESYSQSMLFSNSQMGIMSQSVQSDDVEEIRLSSQLNAQQNVFTSKANRTGESTSQSILSNDSQMSAMSQSVQSDDVDDDDEISNDSNLNENSVIHDAAWKPLLDGNLNRLISPPESYVNLAMTSLQIRHLLKLCITKSMIIKFFITLIVRASNVIRNRMYSTENRHYHLALFIYHLSKYEYEVADSLMEISLQKYHHRINIYLAVFTVEENSNYDKFRCRQIIISRNNE
jgi:hypothetical protein